ncbi:protein phosphatase 2C domain-containing protein [Streptomyces sp. NPDC056938]|uniref:protein phosphatase 2C domain-containing protein n=1 Tax=unclassified Streptomyces TaxID=2593676 RepID=UPI003644534D
MSQQGERNSGRHGQGDDWWGQLYDDSTDDTGPTPAPDTLDDRFASASGTVSAGPERADEQEPVAEQVPERAPVPEQVTGRASVPEQVPEQVTGRAPVPEQRMVPPPQPPPPPARPVDAPPPPAPARPVDPPPDPGAPRAPWEPPAHAPGRPQSFPPGPPPSHRPPPPPPSAAPDLRAPDAHAPAPGAARGAGPGQDAVVAEEPEARPEPPVVPYVGDGPPTYDAEPTALPAADPDTLDDLVADTVLDGARYGTSTLRAVSVRGDSARYRGEPRRDCLLTARFGTGPGALILVAMATGARAAPGAHRAAAEACDWIGRAVGRSHARLAEDIRAAHRGELKSGLHRLTDRSLGRLRASAAEQGLEPEEYTASLRCLLLPADPGCRTRVFFGVGGGGLFRLRDGEWQDIEPQVSEASGAPVVGYGSPPPETPDGDRLTMDLGITTPPSPYEPAPEQPRDPFRFRASVARPGDTLLLCTAGLAEPLRGEPELSGHLTRRWDGSGPPGLTAFLADTQVRVKGYADDRTAAAVWEA